MAVRINHSDEEPLYFCTFTCFKWLNLFELLNGYDLVYKWFTYLRNEKGIEAVAYVIMPNHLHCILYFPQTGYDLNKIISNGKRFIAYELIKRLKNSPHRSTLHLLTENVTEKEALKGQKHRVFEKSFDAKPIYSETFLHQKLDYIHSNPVNGKWQLIDDYRHYSHSSASYYELETPGLFVPKDFRDL